MGSIKGKADMRDLKNLEKQFKKLEKKKTDELLFQTSYIKRRLYQGI